MDKLALVLLVLCIVLYALYTRAQRNKASVEHEIKKAEYKREFDAAVDGQQIAKEEYEAALSHYISVRTQFDKFLESRRTKPNS